MKILITNASLVNYTGTEVVVRDLALQLQQLGHQPLVFSRKLGVIARELEDSGVQVTADLKSFGVVPDIIHGQHHSVVVEALLQFPSVPAVLVCHSASSSFDEPFYFPRFLRYVAVDDRCKQRLESVPRIPRAGIETIYNAVNLERFRPRAPLPAKPKRALLFSNYAHARTHLPVVRKAAAMMGLDLDVVGLRTGTAVPNPELVLPKYDIVFAKARCALESMAVGNSVVLCDFAGTGPMVTPGNFDLLRSMNFGQGVLTKPLKPERLIAEIERYNPADAAIVNQRVRAEAGLEAAAGCWIELYSKVIAEFNAMPRDFNGELLETGSYLRRWSYAVRVEWERERLDTFHKIPVIGKHLAGAATRFLNSKRDR